MQNAALLHSSGVLHGRYYDLSAAMTWQMFYMINDKGVELQIMVVLQSLYMYHVISRVLQF